ncbi:MAG: hypothetical protein U5K70_06395 [Halodesulfurarchaeum sp.]|nr:hypothetical protein [Halodesulfurarchaeum sp.]
MKPRERLSISRQRQTQLSRLMQLSLVGFLFVGFYETDVGIMVNSGFGLAITALPAVLERDFEIPMDAGLTLWITAAVFLHAFGTIGLPWMDMSFYQAIGWWDHLTHALSSSLVAGAGYATVRALQAHTREIELPPTVQFTFIIVLVVAFGVVWEVAEFVLAELSLLLGAEPVLTQYGVGDTMLDLVFNTVGAVIVAGLGTARIEPVTRAIGRRLETRRRDGA